MKNYFYAALVFVLLSCDMGGGETGPEDTPAGEVWVWTQYKIPKLADYLTINTVSYAEGVGFIAGSGTDLLKPAVALSPSGEPDSWTVRELDGLVYYNSFAGKISRLNGKFLMTRGSGVRHGLLSPDGVNWTETSIGFGTKAHACGVNAGGGEVYVVGGQNGRAAWSENGMTSWTAMTDTETTFDNGSMAQLYIIAAAWGNGIFVLGGGRGHTAVSADGKAWTGVRGEASISERIFEGPNGFIDALIFADGKFVALGGLDGQAAKSAYSADGVNWTQGGNPPGLTNGKDGPRMAYGGSFIVAVSYNGSAAYSPDGISWVATEIGFGVTAMNLPAAERRGIS